MTTLREQMVQPCQAAMLAMGQLILEARGLGLDALADQLMAQRDEWARTVNRELKRAMGQPRARLRLVATEAPPPATRADYRAIVQAMRAEARAKARAEASAPELPHAG